MVDLVAYFNWTYVSTVCSTGEYGESGIEMFHKEAERKNICSAVNEKVPRAGERERGRGQVEAKEATISKILEAGEKNTSALQPPALRRKEF